MCNHAFFRDSQNVCIVAKRGTIHVFCPGKCNFMYKRISFPLLLREERCRLIIVLTSVSRINFCDCSTKRPKKGALQWISSQKCFVKLCFLQPSYLHTDFNRWRDEDDSEEEDTGIDDNFEAVSCSVKNPKSNF